MTDLQKLSENPSLIIQHIEKQYSINITTENVVDHLVEITNYLNQLSDAIIEQVKSESADIANDDTVSAQLKLKTALRFAKILQTHLGCGEIIANSYILRLSGIG